MWGGPIDNWIQACDRLLALDVDLIVPGHGPITDKRGVLAVKQYLTLVRDRTAAAHAAGASVLDASRQIAKELDSAGYDEWSDGERVIATVTAIYRHLNHDPTPPNIGQTFEMMASFKHAC